MRFPNLIAITIACLLLSVFHSNVARTAEAVAAPLAARSSDEIHQPFKAWVAPIFAEEVKWTDVAQLGVAIIGFVLILMQLAKLKKELAGDAYTSLYEQYVEVCKLFLEKPYLRPYFYEQRAVEATIPDHHRVQAEVEIVAELMTGLLEHAALQEDSIPERIYDECWFEFTKDRFKSPALIAYWRENKKWYAGDFRIMVEDILYGRERRRPKGWRKLLGIFETGREGERRGP